MRGHSFGIATVVLALCAGTAGAEPKPAAEVFFKFDSSEISDQGAAKLTELAKKAENMPGTKIVIDGHADPRGTPAYNVGLTVRRAEAARDYLLAKGVDKDDVILAFFGEDGARRATFAQDRRVSIQLTRDPLYVVIDNRLPVATGLTWNRPATTAEIEGPRATEQMARR